MEGYQARSSSAQRSAAGVPKAGAGDLEKMERPPPPTPGGDQNALLKMLGGRVMARAFELQATELHVRVALLNSLTQLGRPATVPVAAMT